MKNPSEPKKFEVEFHKIPKSVIYKALKGPHGLAALAVVHVLFETWFRNKFRWNPVKLTNDKFQELGLSPQTKLRGLRALESQGSVSVEWREGKSPIVTLLWEAIKRKPALWNLTAKL